MTQIWYRPPGTRDPNGKAYATPMWYTIRENRVRVCSGRGDPWDVSLGFNCQTGAQADFSQYGYLPVKAVGDTVDVDYLMDRGL